MSSLPTQTILGFYAWTRTPHWGAAEGNVIRVSLLCVGRRALQEDGCRQELWICPQKSSTLHFSAVGGEPWLDDTQKKPPSATLLVLCATAPAFPLLFQPPPGSFVLLTESCVHPAPSLGPFPCLSSAVQRSRCGAGWISFATAHQPPSI